MGTNKKAAFWATAASIATVAGAVWAIFVYIVPLKGDSGEKASVSQVNSGGANIGTMQGGEITINQVTPVGNILPEASDTARVTLQRLGVRWNAESFVGAIVDGDLRVLELFLKGGMNYSLNYKGASAIVYALQPSATNRIEVVKTFLKYGYKPTEDLLDARLMQGYGSIPPHFDQKDTPKKYAAWEKTFAGPADLWLVIRASYAGPEKGDFELLDLLGKNGADFKISLSFLRTDGSAYDATPVYWDVRNRIELLAGVPLTKRPDKLN